MKNHTVIRNVQNPYEINKLIDKIFLENLNTVESSKKNSSIANFMDEHF